MSEDAETAQIVRPQNGFIRVSDAVQIVNPLMPMLEFNRQQRTLFAETVRDIANVGGGAMMFGSFLSDRPFSLAIAIAGFTVCAAGVTFAISVIGRKP